MTHQSELPEGEELLKLVISAGKLLSDKTVKLQLQVSMINILSCLHFERNTSVNGLCLAFVHRQYQRPSLIF